MKSISQRKAEQERRKAALTAHAKIVGERLRELRLASSRTQSDVAEAAGITQPSLASIEAGDTLEISARTLAGLCRALDTTWEYILDGVTEGAAVKSARMEADLIGLFRSLPGEAKEPFVQAARMATSMAARRRDTPPASAPSTAAQEPASPADFAMLTNRAKRKPAAVGKRSKRQR